MYQLPWHFLCYCFEKIRLRLTNTSAHKRKEEKKKKNVFTFLSILPHHKKFKKNKPINGQWGAGTRAYGYFFLLIHSRLAIYTPRRVFLNK